MQLLFGFLQIWQSEMSLSFLLATCLAFSIRVFLLFFMQGSKLLLFCVIMLPNIILRNFFTNVVVSIVDAVRRRRLYKLSRPVLKVFINDLLLIFKILMVFVLPEGVLALNEE